MAALCVSTPSVLLRTTSVIRRYDTIKARSDLYRHSIYTCRTLALSERLSPPVCPPPIGATQVGGVTLVVLNTAETAAELSTVDSSTGASLGR
jgi:hypothetical protein